MDGDRVGQRDFVKLPEFINDLAWRKNHRHLALQRINLHNLPNVAVKHLLVVVVLGLDNFVASAELPAELLHGRFVRPGRIEFRLQTRVQLADAERASIHRTEHLYVADRIKLELVWDAALDQVQQRISNPLRLLCSTK